MEYSILPVTPFQQNCTLMWCERTRRAAVIDPGGEAERILERVSRLNLRLDFILLTHGHLDHVGAANEIARQTGLPIVGPHEEDAFLFKALPGQCEMFGFPPIDPFTPDRWLEEGETLEIGDQRLEVLHCPGHTPGHIVLVDRDQGLAQVGDVLFRGSIGRTDFPRGNHRQLIESIQRKLFALGDDIRFIPGHGPMSSFGDERQTNPFVRG